MAEAKDEESSIALDGLRIDESGRIFVQPYLHNETWPNMYPPSTHDRCLPNSFMRESSLDEFGFLRPDGGESTYELTDMFRLRLLGCGAEIARILLHEQSPTKPNDDYAAYTGSLGISLAFSAVSQLLALRGTERLRTEEGKTTTPLVIFGMSSTEANDYSSVYADIAAQEASQHRTQVSYTMGSPGVIARAAHAALRENRAEILLDRVKALTNLARRAEEVHRPDEILYGRSGYLWALLYVKHQCLSVLRIAQKYKGLDVVNAQIKAKNERKRQEYKLRQKIREDLARQMSQGGDASQWPMDYNLPPDDNDLIEDPLIPPPVRPRRPSTAICAAIAASIEHIDMTVTRMATLLAMKGKVDNERVKKEVISYMNKFADTDDIKAIFRSNKKNRSLDDYSEDVVGMIIGAGRAIKAEEESKDKIISMSRNGQVNWPGTNAYKALTALAAPHYLPLSQSPLTKLVPFPPLYYAWHDKPYLGGAHGLAGILFVLLQSHLCQHDPDELEAMQQVCYGEDVVAERNARLAEGLHRAITQESEGPVAIDLGLGQGEGYGNVPRKFIRHAMQLESFEYTGQEALEYSHLVEGYRRVLGQPSNAKASTSDTHISSSLDPLIQKLTSEAASSPSSSSSSSSSIPLGNTRLANQFANPLAPYSLTFPPQLLSDVFQSVRWLLTVPSYPSQNTWSKFRLTYPTIYSKAIAPRPISKKAELHHQQLQQQGSVAGAQGNQGQGQSQGLSEEQVKRLDTLDERLKNIHDQQELLAQECRQLLNDKAVLEEQLARVVAEENADKSKSENDERFKLRRALERQVEDAGEKLAGLEEQLEQFEIDENSTQAEIDKLVEGLNNSGNEGGRRSVTGGNLGQMDDGPHRTSTPRMHDGESRTSVNPLPSNKGDKSDDNALAFPSTPTIVEFCEEDETVHWCHGAPSFPSVALSAAEALIRQYLTLPHPSNDNEGSALNNTSASSNINNSGSSSSSSSSSSGRGRTPTQSSVKHKKDEEIKTLRNRLTFEIAFYIQRAMRLAHVVWARGILRKGVGLCHGVSGSVYVCLSLYRFLYQYSTILNSMGIHPGISLAALSSSTRSSSSSSSSSPIPGSVGSDDNRMGGTTPLPLSDHIPTWRMESKQWLLRTCALLHYACDWRALTEVEEMRQPDRPLSLFEGLTGLLHAICDVCLDPLSGGMPGYDSVAFQPETVLVLE